MEVEFLGLKIKSITINLVIFISFFIWLVQIIKNYKYNRQFKKFKSYVEINTILYIHGSYFDNDIYFENKDKANLNEILNINNKIIRRIIEDLKKDEYIIVEEVDGGTFIMKNL